MHQGDRDGVKGLYHINAVDCVTQWELVATCEKISEAYLLPVIEALLKAFPFRVLGFHADNEVAGLRLAASRMAYTCDKSWQGSPCPFVGWRIVSACQPP